MNLKRLAFLEQKTFGDSSETAAVRQAPDEILLLRYGKNDYTRDGQHGSFDFHEEDADQIIDEFTLRAKDLVIDYEHQTLSGTQAPAAGWINSLCKTSAGLSAKVRYWTEQAMNYLKNGEYRYYSPVLNFSRSGKTVSALHSVAITNHPALHNIPALVADDTSADVDPFSNKNITEKKEKNMKELMDMLGLVALADSSAEEQMGALRKELRKLLDSRKELGDFLKLHDCESLDKLSGKIQAMCPLADKVELEKSLRRRDAENMVGKAFSDGRITEAFRGWAMGFAEKDPAGFSEWMKSAPVIVPDNKDLQIKESPAAVKAFSDEEVKILRNLGLNDEQIKKIKENK